MALQAQLDTLRRRIEGNLPPRFVKIMHDATAALEASGIRDTALSVGDLAPSFS